MICQQCKVPFRPWHGTQRFCSHECHNESMRAARSIDVDTLRTLAVTGMSKSRMARDLGVGRFVIRRLMDRYGLNQIWRKHRYA
jgi:DNA-binding NtrC family response regulator